MSITKNRLVFAQLILLALLCFSLAAFAPVDWSGHYRSFEGRMVLAMPIRLPDLDEPHAWVPDLTTGLSTTVSDDARQRALREVVIDVRLTAPTCSDYSWSPGIADVTSGLVCIGEGYWRPNGRAYYLLAHELAHIALSDQGRVHEGLGHGAEHSWVTLVILDRLLEREGVSGWRRRQIGRAVEQTHTHCQSAVKC